LFSKWFNTDYNSKLSQRFNSTGSFNDEDEKDELKEAKENQLLLQIKKYKQNRDTINIPFANKT
jgi:hypothetical protein